MHAVLLSAFGACLHVVLIPMATLFAYFHYSIVKYKAS